jgi:hypothetical protein
LGDRLVLEDQYLDVLALGKLLHKGNSTSARHCADCELICFHYARAEDQAEERPKTPLSPAGMVGSVNGASQPRQITGEPVREGQYSLRWMFVLTAVAAVVLLLITNFSLLSIQITILFVCGCVAVQMLVRAWRDPLPPE